MKVEYISTLPGAEAPRVPLSPAVAVGDLVFTSGQVGFAPGTTTLAEGLEAQTRAVMENLKAALEAAGSSLSHVVKTLCFLAEGEDFAAFNAVYAEYFPEGRRPARSTVRSGFAAPGVLVEVECVAVRAG
jgi:2-iminobutanoate/2-iminopropanoate deaminase